MAARQWLNILPALWRSLVLRRRIPFFVAWNLTFKCNLNCRYCGTHDVTGPELDTAGVSAGLDALWRLGARWITFGGGEPLLREDIGRILGHAKRLGFRVFLSTNGAFAKEKSDALRQADHVNLSLDGEREVHDLIRGNGAFDKAMEAVSVCRELGVPVSLLCVLSSRNLGQVRNVLEIAAKNRLLVMFQPATALLNSSSRPNPVSPPVEAYRTTIDLLIALKKKGAPIRNSLTGLKHLARWPDPSPLPCPAGRMMAVVEADGSMLACHLDQSRAPGLLPGAWGGLRFNSLSLPSGCVQCWCAPVVELSLLRSFSPEAVLNAFRLLR